jgi:DNA repair exonuclease SbcCD ATPase subunit
MLFKESMLHSLLQDIGHRLAKKPFTRMSWWRGKRWIAVFLIIPPLSKECPLWKRDEASLRSLRLFGLEPQVLHAELQHYWRKPFWQRWWWGLFTAIHHKRKAYAYYQRCLAFGKAQKQPSYTVSAFKGSGRERALLLELVAWLDRDIRQCEKILEKHAGDLNWLKNRFTPILSQYEQKTKQRLLKYMDKKLKKLPMVRSRIKKEYQELGKFMRDYLLYGLFPPEQGSVHNDEVTVSSGAYQATEHRVVSDNQELVYLGPAVATRNMLRMCSIGETDLGHMKAVVPWVKLKREEIASLLKEGRPDAYIEIDTLLRESLKNIKELVAPQIEDYQQLINQARQGNVECEKAIELSEKLQLNLKNFFLPTVLLFHPDQSSGNEDLSRIKTELFKEFNQLLEDSRETLIQGLQALKNCIPKRATYLNIWDEMERHREELQRHREELQRNREESKRNREETRAKVEKFMAELEKEPVQRAQKQTEWDAKIDRMEEKIERLSDLWTEDITMHHTSEKAMPSQDQVSSADFEPGPPHDDERLTLRLGFL